MATTPLEPVIEAAMALPKSATGDNGSATQQSVDDLIKADQYLAGRRRPPVRFPGAPDLDNIPARHMTRRHASNRGADRNPASGDR